MQIYCLNDDRRLADFTHAASEHKNTKKLCDCRGKGTIVIKKEQLKVILN